MNEILAFDPGYQRTRIGVLRESGQVFHEATAHEDALEAGLSIVGGTPSAVVLPKGPPADVYPWHPRNALAASAKGYCRVTGIPCIVAGSGSDVPAVLPPNARLSGFPGYERKATFYEIPERDACEAAARELGVPFERSRIVVTYMGDEVSVSARYGGSVVDSTDPAACEGPFGLTSCGTLPATAFVSYAASALQSGVSALELVKRMKSSGAISYADAGDAAGALDAMAYQIAKEVGRQLAAFDGRLDCVVLCGPGASIRPLALGIEERVKKWARVLRFREDLIMPRLFLEGTKALSQK